MKRHIVVVFLSFFCTASVFGAFDMVKGVNPGSAGMANARTAIINDTGSLLLNPSGLADLDHASIMVSGSLLYPGLSTAGSYKTTLLAGIPFNKRVSIGAGVIFFSSFHYSELSVLLGAGFKPVDRVSLGLTLKLLNWSGDVVSINETSMQSLGQTVFTADAGIKVSILQGFFAGASVKNINSPDLASSSSGIKDPLPVEFAVGLGYQANTVAADLDIGYAGDMLEYRIGCEVYLLKKILALRAGTVLYELGASGLDVNAGLSLNVPVRKSNIRIDYSTSFNQASPYLASHNIAFTLAL